MLRVTFLGTSSSRPTVRRNVSALAVQREGDLYLFDCGEGTQRQMMRFGVGFALEQIFITHLHADHYLGLPGLLRTLSLQGRTEELVIWGPDDGSDTLRTAAHAGGDRFSFPLQVRELPVGAAVRFDGYRIETFPTDHAPGSFGLALVEETRPGRFDVDGARRLGVPEGPLFGKLHRGEPVELPDGSVIDPKDLVGPPRRGRRLVYSSDTTTCDSVIAAAATADLLIHECTFSEEETGRALETRHSTARQAAQVAARAGARRLVLTHFSARHSEQAHRLVKEAREVFPAVEAAEDGLEIEVPLPADSGVAVE
ncbi:MAG: ribonuclease Z [marine benthic group bacterium]|nr:ribonuclease Z [Gemmatimonadota bacterium]MCL7980348.1 ribonuclease Z [Gemmatimonadota bacterium]MCL7985329.1 ribonuclease Z [Gemmatimonadota bacterium]